jgi:hypothetical protein
MDVSTFTDKMMDMACAICSINFDETAPYPTMTMTDMSCALARINAHIGELCDKLLTNESARISMRAGITRARYTLRRSVKAGESRGDVTARVCVVLDNVQMGLGALLLSFIARKKLAMTSLILD